MKKKSGSIEERTRKGSQSIDKDKLIPVEEPDFPAVEQLEQDEEGWPQPPDLIRVFKNGAGQSKVTGNIIYPPGTFSEDPNKFDTEKSRQAYLAKIQKKEQAIIESIEEMTGKDFLDEYGEAAGLLWKQIVKGQDNKKYGGRERVEAWKEIGKQAGIVPDKNKQAQHQQQGGALTGITPELAREIRMIIQALRDESER